jgi:hypothetical protein
MAAYEQFFNGALEDYDYPKENIEEALKDLPKINFPPKK